MTTHHPNIGRGSSPPQILADKLRYFYRWLYYRCYRYDERSWGKYWRHWDGAAVYVLIIFAMNLIALSNLSIFLFGVWFPTNIPDWIVFGIGVSIAVAHNAYWRSRYKHVLNEFSRETADEQQRGDRLFGSYLVSSLLLMIATFALLAIAAGSK